MQLTHSMQSGGGLLLVVNDPRCPAPTVPSGGPRRAIIVDDDPAVRRAMSRRLRPELDLYVCVSVREATEVLSQIDRIDLALVDLHLPDGSGEEVLRLVARWPDAISVLMSGSLPAGAMRLGAVPTSVPATRVPATRVPATRVPATSAPAGNIERESPPGLALENRALAHLVLPKPIPSHVIDALKKAVLELAKD